MATHEELRGLFADGALRNKIEAACVITAWAIFAEDAGTTNHANRLVWAKQVFDGPRNAAGKMLMGLLAANKDESVATIQAASDETLQALVDGSVNVFADGS